MRYPLSRLSLQLADEIEAIEIISDYEGHRQPSFKVNSENWDQVSITVIFAIPFQEDERSLLEHLIETIQKRTLGD